MSYPGAAVDDLKARQRYANAQQRNVTDEEWRLVRERRRQRREIDALEAEVDSLRRDRNRAVELLEELVATTHPEAMADAEEFLQPFREKGRNDDR